MPTKAIVQKKQKAFLQIKQRLRYNLGHENWLNEFNDFVQSQNLTHDDFDRQRLVHWAVVEVRTDKLQAVLECLRAHGSDLDEEENDDHRLRPIQRAILRYAYPRSIASADVLLKRVKILVGLGVRHDEYPLHGQDLKVMDRVTRDLKERYPLDLDRLKGALKATDDEVPPLLESSMEDSDDDDDDDLPPPKRTKTDQASAGFEDFSQNFNKAMFSDVTLRVGGLRILAHRQLLMERSDVFNSMLGNERFKEHTQKEIELNAVDARVFKAFLEALYKGKAVAVKTIDPLDLLETRQMYAAKLDPSGLYDAVSKSLDAGNVLGALKRAKLHGIQPVVEACRRYIWTYNIKILQRDGALLDEEDKDEVLAELKRAGHCKLVGPHLA